MIAPRARERAGPPSPPERRPPRQGGDSSPYIHATSAVGRSAGSARRGLVRFAGALVAAALLALTGALALPQSAHAQTVTTLVSNKGQAASSDSAVTVTQPRSQRFTTGSDPDGYSLSSVELETTGAGRFSLLVCGVVDITPTSSCTGLTAPSGSAAGRKSFTAPTGTVLAAGTTYSLLMTDANTSISLKATTSDAEDAGHVSGWSIADVFEFQQSTGWSSAAAKSYKVVIKGTVVGVPTVTATAVSSSPDANGSYETGEVIQVTVTFTEAVTVDTTNGTPSLELTIGSNTRDAEYAAADSTATALVFAYPVTTNDHDQNGISIDANALELNGGAIHKEGDTSTDALLTHGALSTQSGHRVNRRPVIVSGGVSVTSSPDANSSYATDDVIQVTVTFDEAVTVDTTNGTPSLALTIGSNTRYAGYSASDSTTTALVFAYPVTTNDNDQNGISIDANVLELNGGAIHKEGDTSTDALLTHGALSTQSGHRVNRRPVIVSGGVSVTSSPDANSSYATDDVIQVTVTFDEAVTVATTDGTPSLELTIGSNPRDAEYAAADSTATALVFAYPVTADDNDQNGISIDANALELNGGAIHKEGDTSTDALLTHGALSTQSGHRVNRRPVIVSGGVSVTSSPDANSSYATDDVIQVTVTFDEAVTVDTTNGTPSLELTIGSNTRYAGYSASDSTTTALVFAYPVVAEDNDNDGISIDANALELNGGAIHKEGDTSTDALLTHGALSTQSGHRVNRDAFIVSGGVSVISTPRAATETYGAGETIEIEVEFSEAVNATTDTDFVISVSGMRRAALLRGNLTDKLVFGYTVQTADSDSNGIWIGDQDRTLVGNRRGAPQNGAITSVATGRAADLTHGGLGTQSGHEVDGNLTPPSTAPVWSATMTAGDTQAGHGYDRTDLDAPTIGALDDDNFDYGSSSYGVLAIDVATNVVRFVVAETGLPTNEILTLELGGHALAFSDRHNAISGQSQWYWAVPAELDDPATEFPVGSTATVCLRTATQVCPAGRIVTPNNPPVFTSSATLSYPETGASLRVVAVDNDEGDDVTGYAITGGADNLFFLGVNEGRLFFTRHRTSRTRGTRAPTTATR